MVAPILLPRSDTTMRLGADERIKLAGGNPRRRGRIEPAVSSSEAK
jgi:hypothetical protein